MSGSKKTRSKTGSSKKSYVKRVEEIEEEEDRQEEEVFKKKKKKSVSKHVELDSDSEEEPDESDQIYEQHKKSVAFLKKHNIKLSTITLNCKLGTNVHVDAFAKYIKLKPKEVVSVKYGKRTDNATNRSIIVIKSKKKPSKRNFFNQVTIMMQPQNNLERNPMNIKVFKNGSLQVTGCKDMDDFFNVGNTLVKVLKRGRTIKKKEKKVKVDFIEDPDAIGLYETSIRMVNSDFKLNYKVDREKLFKLLKKNHRPGTKDKDLGVIECKYEPTAGHSSVDIKYHYDEKTKPSIFIFQTGSVIITGWKAYPQLIAAYNFTIKLLNKYLDQIKIVEIDREAAKIELAKYFKNKKKILEEEEEE